MATKKKAGVSPKARKDHGRTRGKGGLFTGSKAKKKKGY